MLSALLLAAAATTFFFSSMLSWDQGDVVISCRLCLSSTKIGKVAAAFVTRLTPDGFCFLNIQHQLSLFPLLLGCKSSLCLDGGDAHTSTLGLLSYFFFSGTHTCIIKNISMVTFQLWCLVSTFQRRSVKIQILFFVLIFLIHIVGPSSLFYANHLCIHGSIIRNGYQTGNMIAPPPRGPLKVLQQKKKSYGPKNNFPHRPEYENKCL